MKIDKDEMYSNDSKCLRLSKLIKDSDDSVLFDDGLGPSAKKRKPVTSPSSTKINASLQCWNMLEHRRTGRGAVKNVQRKGIKRIERKEDLKLVKWIRGLNPEGWKARPKHLAMAPPSAAEIQAGQRLPQAAAAAKPPRGPEATLPKTTLHSLAC